jgi:hypothetical protein
MLRVLPPPTYRTSCSPRNDWMSSSVRSNRSRYVGSNERAGNASRKSCTDLAMFGDAVGTRQTFGLGASTKPRT